MCNNFETPTTQVLIFKTLSLERTEGIQQHSFFYHAFFEIDE